MNEKIEIAKIAAQLTIAILEDKSGQLGKVLHHARSPGGADSKTPDVLAAFDVVLKHVQSTLIAQ